jgi:hypothetical protein
VLISIFYRIEAQLTKEREVTVLQNRHLPERLRQAQDRTGQIVVVNHGVVLPKIEHADDTTVPLGSRSTYVPGEVVGSAVVAGAVAHGDELIVYAGLLQAQQRA